MLILEAPILRSRVPGVMLCASNPASCSSALWEAVGAGSWSWVLAFHVGNPDEILSSWLQLGPTLVIAVIWQ